MSVEERAIVLPALSRKSSARLKSRHGLSAILPGGLLATGTKPRTARVDRGLLLLNAAGGLVATGYVAAGLWRSPGPRRRSALTEPPGGERFWAAQALVRTWAVSVPLLLSVARSRPDPALLVVAGLVQLGDATVGAWCRKPRMTIAPGLMGLVHLATARRRIGAATTGTAWTARTEVPA